MQRRGSSGHPVKGQRRIGPRARKAPIASVSAADLQEQLDRRTRELDEALEQLAGTSEVLRVISSSPGDLQPVFDTILSSAARICRAEYGLLFLWLGGGQYRVAALHGVPLQLVEYRRRKPVVRPAPRTGLGRVASSKHREAAWWGNRSRYAARRVHRNQGDFTACVCGTFLNGVIVSMSAFGPKADIPLCRI